MEISIAIPTYNRAQNLGKCIEHVMNQRQMEGIDWELVVVDNNSSDHTAELVRELQEKYPGRIRYEFEAEQGVSHARNRGISSTDSRYLVYIDDDILVEPSWLRAVYSTFKEHRSDAVGGRIWVKSPNEIPKWIREDMRGFLGHKDHGDMRFRMDGREIFPFGGNMAFDRRIFDRVGRFDVRIGRKGEGRKREELFKGEEPELFNRIANVGGKIDYAPDAIVYHKILPHQLEKWFFRSLHFSDGYQKAMLGDAFFPRQLFGIPLFLIRETIETIYEYLRQVVTRGSDYAFRQQMTVHYLIGKMTCYYKMNSSKYKTVK